MSKSIFDICDELRVYEDPQNPELGKIPTGVFKPQSAEEMDQGVRAMVSDSVCSAPSWDEIQSFISLSWYFNQNPLPALRRRLKRWGWTCFAHCWAKDQDIGDIGWEPHEWDDQADLPATYRTVWPNVMVGASTIYFRPSDRYEAERIASAFMGE